MRRCRAFAIESIGAALALASSVAACAGDGGVARADEPITLPAGNTFVATSSELIGGVYDLAVAPDGEVYVADYGHKHLLVLSPDGTVRDTIGREGSGPGEFQRPWVLHAGADSVRVLDAETNLVQVFDRAGSFARSYQLDVPGVGFGAGRDFRDDGALAVAIEGFDSAMVALVNPTGAAGARFGEPVVPPTSFFDFGAIKDEIREGRVPSAFRNQALVVWGPERSVYLAFLTEPEVRRYDADGTLRWTRTLDEPVFRSTFERFVQRNIEEQNAARLHSLRYIEDAAVVGGDLWLLVNTADEANGLMLVLDPDDGAVRRRITFAGLPNTGHFAVDETRRRLYMAPRGDASVLMFDLPDS